jgi:hypothetical protein
MSRVLREDIEGRTLNPIGPIRWMAPESIAHGVYSKKSDVWMFGALVYEIVAQREPHSDKDPMKISREIRFVIFRNNQTQYICEYIYRTFTISIFDSKYSDQGLTPEIPRGCPEKLAQLMRMCWNKDPNQRPVSPLSQSQSSHSQFLIFSNCVCF